MKKIIVITIVLNVIALIFFGIYFAAIPYKQTLVPSLDKMITIYGDHQDFSGAKDRNLLEQGAIKIIKDLVSAYKTSLSLIQILISVGVFICIYNISISLYIIMGLSYIGAEKS